MAGLKKKITKPKRIKSKLTAPLNQAINETLKDFIPEVKANSKDPDMEYRLSLQNHLLEVCKQILSEHGAEIIARAEAKIKALQTMGAHR